MVSNNLLNYRLKIAVKISMLLSGLTETLCIHLLKLVDIIDMLQQGNNQFDEINNLADKILLFNIEAVLERISALKIDDAEMMRHYRDLLNLSKKTDTFSFNLAIEHLSECLTSLGKHVNINYPDIKNIQV